MQVFDDIERFRSACEALRRAGKTLGFVPTMGALHSGHLALIRHARELGTEVAVSIFVNPTQFGPSEDFAKYPRTLPQDLERCRDAGAALVVTPSALQMYPPGESTRVRVSRMSEGLCGASRPGHFEGVATVVTKLFAIAGPCVAVFGRKDYQQLKVIERLCRDLLLPVRVVGHPIVRERDGLALSSRNAYLDAGERQQALAIARGLSLAVRAFEAGQRSSAQLRREVADTLGRGGLRIDYVEITDPESLEVIAAEQSIPGARALLAVAAFAGRTRLIDNVVLGEDSTPVSEEPS